MDYFWSPSTLQFIPVMLQGAYVFSGTFPTDAALIDDSVSSVYRGTPPSGQMLGVSSGGQPAWVEA